MAHIDHQGSNQTRLLAYHPEATIEQRELDLSGLPTVALLGQEDPYSSHDDDDEISGRELFPDPHCDIELLADTALNAHGNEGAAAAGDYQSVDNLDQTMDAMMATEDNVAATENHAENSVCFSQWGYFWIVSHGLSSQLKILLPMM